MAVTAWSPLHLVALLTMVCLAATAVDAAQQLRPVADQAALAEQLLSENPQEPYERLVAKTRTKALPTS